MQPSSSSRFSSKRPSLVARGDEWKTVFSSIKSRWQNLEKMEEEPASVPRKSVKPGEGESAPRKSFKNVPVLGDDGQVVEASGPSGVAAIRRSLLAQSIEPVTDRQIEEQRAKDREAPIPESAPPAPAPAPALEKTTTTTTTTKVAAAPAPVAAASDAPAAGTVTDPVTATANAVTSGFMAARATFSPRTAKPSPLVDTKTDRRAVALMMERAVEMARVEMERQQMSGQVSGLSTGGPPPDTEPPRPASAPAPTEEQTQKPAAPTTPRAASPPRAPPARLDNFVRPVAVPAGEGGALTPRAEGPRGSVASAVGTPRRSVGPGGHRLSVGVQVVAMEDSVVVPASSEEPPPAPVEEPPPLPPTLVAGGSEGRDRNRSKSWNPAESAVASGRAGAQSIDSDVRERVQEVRKVVSVRLEGMLNMAQPGVPGQVAGEVGPKEFEKRLEEEVRKELGGVVTRRQSTPAVAGVPMGSSSGAGVPSALGMRLNLVSPPPAEDPRPPSRLKSPSPSPQMKSILGSVKEVSDVDTAIALFPSPPAVVPGSLGSSVASPTGHLGASLASTVQNFQRVDDLMAYSASSAGLDSNAPATMDKPIDVSKITEDLFTSPPVISAPPPPVPVEKPPPRPEERPVHAAAGAAGGSSTGYSTFGATTPPGTSPPPIPSSNPPLPPGIRVDPDRADSDETFEGQEKRLTVRFEESDVRSVLGNMSQARASTDSQPETFVSDYSSVIVDGLPRPWQEHRTNEGAVFYFNPETSQSQWERPVPLSMVSIAATGTNYDSDDISDCDDLDDIHVGSGLNDHSHITATADGEDDEALPDGPGGDPMVEPSATMRSSFMSTGSKKSLVMEDAEPSRFFRNSAALSDVIEGMRPQAVDTLIAAVEEDDVLQAVPEEAEEAPDPDPARARPRAVKFKAVAPVWNPFINRLLDGAFMVEKTPGLKMSVRRGVPPAFRGKFWQIFCGARAYRQESEDKRCMGYLEILHKYDGKESAATEQIERDLYRTFPREMTEGGIEELRRVLVAYSWRNTAVGYCQSMNFIVALLLLFMEEDEAYWMLCVIVEKLLPDEYYTTSMRGVLVDTRVFEDLLAEKMPRLAAHLNSLGAMMGLILPQWMLCVYINVVPLETLLRVWDAFFFEGSKVLVRIALAIFKLCEGELLRQTEFSGVLDVLNTAPYEWFDADALMKTAWKIGSLPAKKLQEKRAQYLAQMSAEGGGMGSEWAQQAEARVDDPGDKRLSAALAKAVRSVSTVQQKMGAAMNKLGDTANKVKSEVRRASERGASVHSGTFKPYVVDAKDDAKDGPTRPPPVPTIRNIIQDSGRDVPPSECTHDRSVKFQETPPPSHPPPIPTTAPPPPPGEISRGRVYSVGNTVVQFPLRRRTESGCGRTMRTDSLDHVDPKYADRYNNMSRLVEGNELPLVVLIDDHFTDSGEPPELPPEAYEH